MQSDAPDKPVDSLPDDAGSAMPEPPPVVPAPPLSASGLDTAQIAPEDLAEIAALFSPRHLSWEEAAPVYRSIEPDGAALRPQLKLASITPGLEPPRTLKIKILPLPNRIHPRHLSLELHRPQLHRGLAPVLALPVRRQRLRTSQLPLDLQESLLRALYKKYGEAAHDLHVESVFAQIPPELASSVRISRDGQEAAFLVPAGFDPRKASGGHYLVNLTTESGETRRVLFRL